MIESNTTQLLDNAFFNRGNSKYHLGDDYKGAIADFDAAIELDSEDAVAYNNRGASKGKLGDYEGAIADYDRAIELDPRNATVIFPPKTEP